MPSKLDQYASPSQKVLGLFGLLLFSGERYSLSRLAGILKCSKQTVMRMMEQIERSHEASIESGIEDNQRWYRLKGPGTKPNVSLTAKEIQRLVLCRDMVRHLLPEEFRKELDRTIVRTTVLLPSPEEKPVALSSVCGASFKGGIDYSPFQDMLDTLIVAIQKSKVCDVEYRSAHSGQVRKHFFAPLKIVSYRESFYAEGFKVQDRGAPDPVYDMTLSVHRLVSVVLTRRSHGFSEDDLGRKPGFGLMGGEPFRVKVAFEKESAPYVRERTWSQDQNVTDIGGGRITLEFTARSRAEVVSWVLSFGMQAELLEPVGLRDELCRQVKGLANRYGR